MKKVIKITALAICISGFITSNPGFSFDISPDPREAAKLSEKGYGKFIKDIADQTTQILGQSLDEIVNPETEMRLGNLFKKMKFAAMYGVEIEEIKTPETENVWVVKEKFNIDQPGAKGKGPSITDPRVRDTLKVCENFARYLCKSSDIRGFMHVYDFFNDNTLHSVHFRETEFSYLQRIMLERITLAYYYDILKQLRPEKNIEIDKFHTRAESDFKNKSHGFNNSEDYWKTTDRATKVIRDSISVNHPKIEIPQKPTFAEAKAGLKKFVDGVKGTETLQKVSITSLEAEAITKINGCFQFFPELSGIEKINEFENQLTISDADCVQNMATLLSEDSSLTNLSALKQWSQGSVKTLVSNAKLAIAQDFAEFNVLLEIENVLKKIGEIKAIKELTIEEKTHLLDLMNKAFFKQHKDTVMNAIISDMLNSMGIVDTLFACCKEITKASSLEELSIDIFNVEQSFINS